MAREPQDERVRSSESGIIPSAQPFGPHKPLIFKVFLVSAANESEIRDAFNLVMKVNGLSPKAIELSEKYFFDIPVRMQRAGEGEKESHLAVNLKQKQMNAVTVKTSKN